MAQAVSDFDVAALLARLRVAPRRVTSDSRAVEPGVAFAAFPGALHDGRAFIGDAIARGAPAVLWEAAGWTWDPKHEVPNLPVEDLRDRLGPIADFIYGSPSAELWMVGVTGTNGKTSCSQWIAHAFAAVGRRAAVIGTLGSGFPGALTPAAHTTPDAAVLQETLASLKRAGATVVAMEVSSIGLDQGRVNGTRFDVALFTNLTRDHLDYHGTMAAYGAAKAKLFDRPGLAVAVVNADDAFGDRIAGLARARGARVLGCGVNGGDITATAIAATADGMALSVATPWGSGRFETRVVGTFNVSNLLGTLGVLLASEVPLAAALDAMATIQPPPGRMQRLGGGSAPLVVIDYAHTPDALEKVLAALRPAVAAGGSLVCLFGCGGDRDPGKRREMGRIAASLADRVVVTSDNPRSEDPTSIAMAIAAARAGDVVLLAGKGHEDYQEAHGVRTPFSDAARAAAALARRSVP